MPDQPRALGAGVSEVLGDDDLIEIGADTGITLLRPSGEGRALLVLHQPGPDTTAVLDEADRLSWLAGRGPAPAVVASGRTDEGDETIVLRHPGDATPATPRHPLGPEALIAPLPAPLRSPPPTDGAPAPSHAASRTNKPRIPAPTTAGSKKKTTSSPATKAIAVTTRCASLSIRFYPPDINRQWLLSARTLTRTDVAAH